MPPRHAHEELPCPRCPIFQKNKSEDNYSFLHSKLIEHNKSNQDAISLLKQEKNKNNIILTPKVKRQDFIDKYLVFGSKQVSKLLSKIKDKSTSILTKTMN